MYLLELCHNHDHDHGAVEVWVDGEVYCLMQCEPAEIVKAIVALQKEQ